MAITGWQFWIDRGGTFTDVIGVDPRGQTCCRKYLSHHPERYDDAAAFGIREILGLEPGQPIVRGTIAAIKVGTTVATNALLERRGAPTALVITRGFGDALRIGTQHRPRLFDLDIRRPPPLYDDVVEVDERVSAAGESVIPLDDASARAALERVFARGIRSLAIVLMHGYRFPDHERRLAAVARAVGFTQISASHDVNPMIKLVPRGDTTVCDAYLSPVVDGYVGHLADAVDGAPLHFMQSNGGLAPAEHFRGKDAVLSGPAGGVVGYVETSAALGFDRVIGFDMGGTSTDVSHFAGQYERTFDGEIAGVRLRAPMIAVHTVAAGGGSICAFDGLRLRVGPESAGARPGPACYQRGGPLTVTDCNVVLGRIRPDAFPRTFGDHADQPIDRDAAVAALATMVEKLGRQGGEAWTPERLAEGFLRIAVDNVARAIRKVSVEAGHDVRAYALACFGGAGGQHACRVADALGIATILIHPLAGVLSAYGIGLARPRTIREATVNAPISAPGLVAVEAVFETLERAAARPAGATVERRVHARAAGVDTTLPIPFGGLESMRLAFATAHRRRFGFDPAGADIICETIEIEITGPADATGGAIPGHPAITRRESRVTMVSDGRWIEVPCIARESLSPGDTVDGPAIITEALATTVVEPGWRATVEPGRDLILRRAMPVGERRPTVRRDPVTLELFNNVFMSIAEHMGAILQHTARSVNIKERLDFSCAVFDDQGRLVANAPHMPVHLGSMGDSVRAVRDANIDRLTAGSAFAVNAPYAGGTHLPDITVVSPVVLPGEARARFFVASRGHHADIGGITPGSMPPMSKTIADEGVVFDAVPIVEGHAFQDDLVRAILAGSPWPARDPDANIADLKAQCAANAAGTAELIAACERFGKDVVSAYMGHVQDHAETAVRHALTHLSSGSFTCAMDNGATIAVRITVDRAAGTAVVDFTGTSPQTEDNFNAPLAVCRAAVLYVMRTLVDEDIPLNDGCLRPITLIVPGGSILDPRPPAAVVAGNVETSQIVCDALFGALGAVAAAQGTMNNFTFGDDRHQYYETVCGGAGAGPDFDGASAVQTHMTNSRLTDPEVLESRFPVMIEEFSIRHGSGGQGGRHGGDGVRRTVRFLAPMMASILSGRRTTVPFGLGGGSPGLPGVTAVRRSNGESTVLAPTESIALEAGDRLTIETPGGGGYGPPVMKS
jgi:5-oxoprolinase (ATP-hydrolysing)